MIKILAIDDRQDNLISLSALLKNLLPGCNVITAQSGPEGIEKAKIESPDTILLDIKMPDMDGYEVCSKLKEGEATKHIPVIMISAILTDSQDLIKGLDIGADAYLAKPIDANVLMAQVKTSLRMKAAEDALRDQKDILEEEVLKRTAELTKSYVQLKQEMKERKQAEEELEKYRKHLELMVEERTADLKKAQKMLLKKEKLAAIGQLSGSVAHDIRNPLGSIKNSVYFLDRTMKDSADNQIKKHLKIMETEILRANDIITDLMNFSMENKPTMVEGQINNILLDLLKTFNIPAKITVETELDSALPMLPFDTIQLQRVFYSLITNAFQAMAKGGLLKVSSCKYDDFTEVHIQDSGTGISSEELENIFDPLFTTKSKGVGLGLTIVKDFVEKHNGMVEVESEVGKGTTFSVKLPLS